VPGSFRLHLNAEGSTHLPTLKEMPRIAQAGENVIVYEGFQKASRVLLQPGGVFHNRFGAFSHDDFIGAEYGAKVSTRTKGSSSYVHMLAFTPELWTLSLTHRTQILYGIDIAVVCTYLNLQPGAVCVESGTGSGSLSVSLARAVGMSGHVNTFEFNADRAAAITSDFAELRLSSNITVRHRDVCGPDGFAPVAPGTVDAVFLDLPQVRLSVSGSCSGLLLSSSASETSFDPPPPTPTLTPCSHGLRLLTPVMFFEAAARCAHSLRVLNRCAVHCERV
jgi:tRNA (adenine57-N1/adenine58-N1)-methyltransferase catalytic subunit